MIWKELRPKRVLFKCVSFSLSLVLYDMVVFQEKLCFFYTSIVSTLLQCLISQLPAKRRGDWKVFAPLSAWLANQWCGSSALIMKWLRDYLEQCTLATPQPHQLLTLSSPINNWYVRPEGFFIYFYRDTRFLIPVTSPDERGESKGILRGSYVPVLSTVASGKVLWCLHYLNLLGVNVMLPSVEVFKNKQGILGIVGDAAKWEFLEDLCA